MFCGECGTKLEDGARFCPNCGTKQVINNIIDNKANVQNSGMQNMLGNVHMVSPAQSYNGMNQKVKKDKNSKSGLRIACVVVVAMVAVAGVFGVWRFKNSNSNDSEIAKEITDGKDNKITDENNIEVSLDIEEESEESLAQTISGVINDESAIEKAVRLGSQFSSLYNKIYALQTDGTVRVLDTDTGEESKLEGAENLVKFTKFGSSIYWIGLKKDGTIVTDYDDISHVLDKYPKLVDVITCQNTEIFYGLTEDGTVVKLYEYSPYVEECFTDIKQIAREGSRKVLAVKSDGTVVTNSEDDDDIEAVSNWNDIEAILSYGEFDSSRFAIKKDGTVVGFTDGYDYITENWSDAVMVKIFDYTLIGLNSSGKLLLPNDTPDKMWSTCILSRWSDIVTIAGNDRYVLGVQKDGSVIITECGAYQEEPVEYVSVLQEDLQEAISGWRVNVD